MTDREIPCGQSMVVYKALTKDGKSPYRHWEWPLPSDDIPGEWVEVEGPPRLCAHGFHGYHKYADAFEAGHAVYEMELEGPFADDGVKIAGARARLLRRAEAFTPILVGTGDLPCRECGKAHGYYQLTPSSRGLHSWADPDDGHCYFCEDPKVLSDRVVKLLDGSITGVVSVTAIKKALGHV